MIQIQPAQKLPLWTLTTEFRWAQNQNWHANWLHSGKNRNVIHQTANPNSRQSLIRGQCSAKLWFANTEKQNEETASNCYHQIEIRAMKRKAVTSIVNRKDKWQIRKADLLCRKGVQIAIQQKQICHAGKWRKLWFKKTKFWFKKAKLMPQCVAGFSRITMRESQNMIWQAKHNSGG